MSESIYAPPEAEITAPQGDGPRYYVVSPTKFLLLSILTAGLYLAYWMYRNWRQIKAVDNSNIWPVPRGIFSIFFMHSLLADVQASFVRQGKDYEWNPTLIATTFVVLAVISTLAGQFVNYTAQSMLIYLPLLAMPVLYGIVLLGAQKGINAASDDDDGSGNSNITVANYLWMIFGMLMWAINIFAAYALMSSGLI